MLSYQHVYHAGNHADILKHYVLSFVLNSLNKKEKPYTFIDTHSGSGLYDLLDSRSLKTGEAQKGIASLLDDYESKNIELPESFCNFLSFVKTYTSENKYPGSPEIERKLLRKQDFLSLCELHPQEFVNLSENMNGETSLCKLSLHNQNGFDVLKSSTPPVTKRGAVIIDPSYEESSDYENAAKTIIQVHKKWSNGIIMLWYPLLAHRKTEIDNMVNKIINAAKKQNQNIEISDLKLCVNTEDSHIEVDLEKLSDNKKNPPRLYGSGMLVLNSPWHLQEDAEKVLKYLTCVFFQK